MIGIRFLGALLEGAHFGSEGGVGGAEGVEFGLAFLFEPDARFVVGGVSFE